MIDTTLNVRGEPKAQPRTKATATCPKGCRGKIPGCTNPRPFVRMYTPDTAKDWKQAIMLAIKPHVPANPHDLHFTVDCTFYLKRPVTMMRLKDINQVEPHGKKPDRDNLDKAVLDAITQSGFWRDDSLACFGTIRKYYTDKRQGTGARITIRSVEKSQ
jgi:Holliday junction resolvase RusA-like endonuclease